MWSIASHSRKTRLLAREAQPEQRPIIASGLQVVKRSTLSLKRNDPRHIRQRRADRHGRRESLGTPFCFATLIASTLPVQVHSPSRAGRGRGLGPLRPSICVLTFRTFVLQCNHALVYAGRLPFPFPCTARHSFLFVPRNQYATEATHGVTMLFPFVSLGVLGVNKASVRLTPQPASQRSPRRSWRLLQGVQSAGQFQIFNLKSSVGRIEPHLKRARFRRLVP